MGMNEGCPAHGSLLEASSGNLNPTDRIDGDVASDENNLPLLTLFIALKPKAPNEGAALDGGVESSWLSCVEMEADDPTSNSVLIVDAFKCDEVVVEPFVGGWKFSDAFFTSEESPKL